MTQLIIIFLVRKIYFFWPKKKQKDCDQPTHPTKCVALTKNSQLIAERLFACAYFVDEKLDYFRNFVSLFFVWLSLFLSVCGILCVFCRHRMCCLNFLFIYWSFWWRFFGLQCVLVLLFFAVHLLFIHCVGWNLSAANEVLVATYAFWYRNAKAEWVLW